MKKMRKNLLALALVIAMVLSTMPMSFAAEGEETTASTGITVKYDIKGACMPDGAGNTTSVDTGKNPAKYCDFEKTNGFFEYVNDSVSKADDNNNLKLYNEYGLVHVKYNNWFILALNVPVAGEYKIYVNNNAHAKGLVGNFYISETLPAANSSILATENYVGKLQTNTNVSGVKSGIGGSWAMTLDLANPVKNDDGSDATYTFSKAGTYYMAVRAALDSSISGVSQDRFQFGNIWLVSGNGSGYALVGDMTLSADSVKAGENATATATAYKSNDASLVTLTYTSSNTDVATVDPATGAITAKKAGKTTISATAEGSANSISKEFVVTSADASDITVKYDFKTQYINTNANENKTFAGNVTYKNTNGFFQYANDSRGDVADKTWHLRWTKPGMIEMYQNQWIFFEIEVPKAGEYEISMYNGKASLGGDVSVHIYESNGEKPDKNDLTDDNFIGKVDCEDKTIADKTIVQVTTPTYVGSHSFKTAGKYYIGFKALDTDVTPDPLPEGDNAGNYNDTAYVGDIILDGGDGNALIGGVINGVSDTIEIGDTATASASAYLSKTGAAAGNFTYSSDSSAVTIDAESGALTANAEGKAIITATSADALSSCNTITKEVTVKPAEPGESVSDTLVNFTFVSSDVAAGSVSAKGYPTVGEVEIGTSVEATATANDGYEFAYWRNGAGTVLSTKETAIFKFNTNTAVYAEFIKLPDENAAEVPVYFYNGNGNLLESKNVAKGTPFGDAKIANPSLTGFAFKHWSDKDEEIAITNETAIDAVLRAVAIYEDSGEKYTVKADGATVTSDATYGSEVTVTSSDANFKAWKLGDKIVSYNKAFTFYVWDDVTLTSVTEGEEAPIAVLDEVEGKPMLIYSAPENCEIIEAGILFGEGAEIGSYESKAFAKESTGQFTAEPNGEEENKTARGYLIFKKDGVIRVIYAD